MEIRKIMFFNEDYPNRKQSHLTPAVYQFCALMLNLKYMCVRVRV